MTHAYKHATVITEHMFTGKGEAGIFILPLVICYQSTDDCRNPVSQTVGRDPLGPDFWWVQDSFQ